MPARVQTHATYEDLLNAPENMVAELIEGELYAWPRPAARHSYAASALGALLMPPYQFRRGGPGGWWILDEPEVHFGKNVLVPDIAGWRRERMPFIPNSHIFDIAPDWICEVLSDSTARIDRTKKLPIYAKHEVGYAWLVDSVQRSIEVKKLDGETWRDIATFRGDASVRAEPFDGVEIDLSLIWVTPA